MQNIDPNIITTESHTVSAGYVIDGIDYGSRLDVDGYTLAEIISDMVDFWNCADERASEFEVDRIEYTDGDAEVTISGDVFTSDADGAHTTDTNRIDVIITACAN